MIQPQPKYIIEKEEIIKLLVRELGEGRGKKLFGLLMKYIKEV